MESYWILGAGRFGSLAIRRILDKKGPPHLIVVDREARSLKNLRLKEVEVFREDAIEFLSEHPGFGDEWVVPAIPVHVAFAWLCRRLAKKVKVTSIPVPSIIDHQVPNPLRDSMGGICTSVAVFRCPDDCEEPSWMCTVTGKQRETNMFDLIPRIQVEGFVTRVVRSHQLAPGVGGYRLSVLWSLLEEVGSTEKNFLIATACRCHGVINALRW